jgi:hypothetical protein
MGGFSIRILLCLGVLFLRHFAYSCAPSQIIGINANVIPSTDSKNNDASDESSTKDTGQQVTAPSMQRKRLTSLPSESVPIFAPKHAYFFPGKFKERFRATSGTNYFKTFSFKGVGVSLVKSLVDLKSCGVGLRVPITSHFPVYDSVAHFPRLNGMIAYMYPGFVKIDISTSVPLPVVLYWILVVVKSKEFADIFQKSIKATDSVKRVGFTTSFKIHKQIVTPSIGPMILMVPSVSLFQTLLPLYLAVPTVILALFGLMYFCLQIIGLKSKGGVHDPPSATQPITYVLFYWHLLKAQVARLAATMAVNASKSYTRKSSAFGSGIQFNVDSLYPFSETLDSIRSFVVGRRPPPKTSISPRSRFMS